MFILIIKRYSGTKFNAGNYGEQIKIPPIDSEGSYNKSPGLGLEPRLNAPEALVLPLHHPGKIRFIHAF